MRGRRRTPHGPPTLPLTAAGPPGTERRAPACHQRDRGRPRIDGEGATLEPSPGRPGGGKLKSLYFCTQESEERRLTSDDANPLSPNFSIIFNSTSLRLICCKHKQSGFETTSLSTGRANYATPTTFDRCLCSISL